MGKQSTCPLLKKSVPHSFALHKWNADQAFQYFKISWKSWFLLSSFAFSMSTTNSIAFSNPVQAAAHSSRAEFDPGPLACSSCTLDPGIYLVACVCYSVGVQEIQKQHLNVLPLGKVLKKGWERHMLVTPGDGYCLCHALPCPKILNIPHFLLLHVTVSLQCSPKHDPTPPCQSYFHHAPVSIPHSSWANLPWVPLKMLIPSAKYSLSSSKAYSPFKTLLHFTSFM